MVRRPLRLDYVVEPEPGGRDLPRHAVGAIELAVAHAVAALGQQGL